MKKLSFLLCLLVSITAFGQESFTFAPEKPKPGDAITITYIPSGELANTLSKVEGVMYAYGPAFKRKADDLLLTKKGKKYSTVIQTDTAQNFIQLGFFVDKNFDSNFGNGYYIQLYTGDKIKKGSNYSLALFHQFYGEDSGLEKNSEKTLVALKNELIQYPDQKKAIGSFYYGILNAEKPVEGKEALQNEIEVTVKAGLKDESDYSYLEGLYNSGKLTQQGKFVNTLKKEKFPEGKWTAADMINKFQAEVDPAKKEEMYAVIKKNVETKKDWQSYERTLPAFYSSIINAYVKNRNWEKFKKLMSALTDKSDIATKYNSAAHSLMEKNEDLKIAEEFAILATEYARQEWKNPTSARPDYYTAKNWDKQRAENYASHADTYAGVLYKTGNYKKGYELSKEAALTINKGQQPEANKTYALLAEKVLSKKELKPQLEKFVKDGKSGAEVTEVLKRIYVEEAKSEAGFDDYLIALGREAQLKMIDELRAAMINESSPSFILSDFNGNKVNIADLKGKVVIIDFWATWCGPCKASFPGMQKIVNKYKDDANVKFLFIDTWERVDNKLKSASDFITSNKYTFHVLMDEENKVVDQFKVEGIPTKFVLDKDGKIRFKSVGFSGSDEKLMNELSAMIEMANAEKTF